MQDPPSYTDSHFIITTASKVMERPPYCPYPLETTHVRAKGMIAMAPKASKPWQKNGLPFLRSQTLKVANGCRRMLGKEWGVCPKAPRFSSVSPEGPVPHLFVQKKGLGGFTRSCQQWPSFTTLEVSLYLFLYPWFYDLIKWTSSDLVAGLKHIFNLKNQAF